jgi:hypothetical protein
MAKETKKYEPNVKILNSNLDVEKVMKEITPTGTSQFTVECEYMGRKEQRTITVMKYNQKRGQDCPPEYCCSVTPEKPSPMTVTYPPTLSNFFARFPEFDDFEIGSSDTIDRNLENFLVKEYAKDQMIK